MSKDEIRATLLREVHRLIDEAADAAAARLASIAAGASDAAVANLAYPPGDGRSDAHLDGVSDPASWEGDTSSNWTRSVACEVGSCSSAHSQRPKLATSFTGPFGANVNLGAQV
jgi:hypothetical protein